MRNVLTLGLVMALLVARSAQGAPPLLDRVVDESLHLVSPALAETGVVVYRDYHKDVQLADGDQIRDRLVVLLANAVAGAPRGAELHIFYEPSERVLTVRVPDPATRFDVSREFRDPSGHLYRMETRAGEGTEVSAPL